MRRTWLRSLAAAAALTVAGVPPQAAATERPPLVDAARRTDREAVRRLLEQKVAVNGAEEDGTTALLWSSYRDDLESVDRLIRAGADANAANDLGATPLWAASVNGSAAIVGRLLEAGADVNRPLLLGETPLMAASRTGSAAVAALLVERGAAVNATAARDQTALMWAAAQKHPAVVKLLLEHGADLGARSKEWSQVMAVAPHGLLEYNRAIPHGGDTALMFAVRAGDLESVALLVEAGASVDDADAWGVTATAMAAHAGFRDVVAFLLDRGANPNVAAPGFTALHAAIMHRDEAMAGVLIAHGADPNAPVRNWTPTRRSSKDWNFNPELIGATPFWLAARVTHPGIMRLLAAHGADPRAVHRVEYHAGDPVEKRTQSTTPIMAATGMGGGTAWTPIEGGREKREALTLEAVKVAADLGADVNAANDDGRTALDAALTLKFDSVIGFLTARGAVAGKTAPAAPAAGPGR